MTNTTPQARRVMAAGGEWANGMLSETGIRVSNSTETYPSGIRDGDSRVRPLNDTVKHGELPDLNDAATCAVLWGQLRERVEAMGGWMSVTHSGYETSAHLGVHSLDEYFCLEVEADTLAFAFERVASLEATNAQD